MHGGQLLKGKLWRLAATEYGTEQQCHTYAANDGPLARGEVVLLHQKS
jgi:hypothetical protein